MLAICLAMLEDDEDKRRFEQIYDKYNKLISRTALKILGDEEQAFDVTSNVFLAIARNIKSFPDSKEPAHERSYLYMSVRNYCVNEKIKRANKPLILDIDTVVYNGAENGALDLLVQREDIAKIVEYISGMPETYRDVLTMKYVYDMSAKEIADVLNLSPNTVWSIIQRGSVKLQNFIHSEGIR